MKDALTKGTGKRPEMWCFMKQHLEDLIDFESYNHEHYTADAVQDNSPKYIRLVLRRLRTWLVTGKVKTKFPEPQILFNQSQADVLAINKPAGMVCEFGTGVPEVKGVPKAVDLLDSEDDVIQLHEWVGLKLDFECAKKTR